MAAFVSLCRWLWMDVMWLPDGASALTSPGDGWWLGVASPLYPIPTIPCPLPLTSQDDRWWFGAVSPLYPVLFLCIAQNVIATETEPGKPYRVLGYPGLHNTSCFRTQADRTPQNKTKQNQQTTIIHGLTFYYYFLHFFSNFLLYFHYSTWCSITLNFTRRLNMPCWLF